MDVNKSLEQIQKHAQSTYNGTIIVMAEEICLLLKHLFEETKVCNCHPVELAEAKQKTKAKDFVTIQPLKPEKKSKPSKTKSSKVEKDGI